jgi:phosphoglycerate dehydrogenase-like enzyme
VTSFAGRRPVVLVAGASAAAPPPGIETAAASVDLVYAESPDAVAESIGDADAVFAWRPDRALLEPNLPLARRLGWIQSASAGVDRLLYPGLVASDITVTNAGGVFDDAMAEYAIGCMLVFAKGLATTILHSRDGTWEYRNTEPLAGRLLVVVGAGPIGTAVARKASALGMRVEGVATAPRPAAGPYRHIAGSGDLPQATSAADYVVNTLPLTDRTKDAFGERAFAAMKPTARFVNLGRGATVDEDALVHALREGRIAGAALDVFRTEPLPAASPLWGMANVIVSPHMAGDLVGWESRVVDVFQDNLGRWLRGERLRNVVDKARGYVPTS